MFTQADYEQFAATFAQTLGISHTLQFDSPTPCVDSQGVIHLPPIAGNQTQQQSRNTRAALIHELAHIYYQSNREFARQAKMQSQLWQHCFNAALDVADETGIEKLPQVPNPDTRQTLLETNVQYARNPDLKNPATALHWRILATGIIKARLVGARVRHSRYFGNAIIRDNPQIDIKQVFTLLKRCRLAKRVPAQHATLVKYAGKIADLLLSAYDPALPVPTSFTSPLTEACSQTGAEDPAGIVGGNSAARGYVTYPADNSAYQMFLPITKRITERIAVDGDSLLQENSLLSGSSVTDPYRIFTDSAAFGRWNTDDHAEGMAVSVLLDTSGSMDASICRVAGIAQAFADSLADCAEVQLCTFDTSVDQVDSFRQINTLGGGTYTHSAIQAARGFLAGSNAGQKYIVVITDGAPSEPEKTSDQVALAVQEGITVLAVVYSSLIAASSVGRNMPGAHVTCASDIAHLAIELETITSLL